MYISKNVKILAEYHESGVYAWYLYYVLYKGKLVGKKRIGLKNEVMPYIFDSQKHAERYIYRKGLLKSKKTFIDVEFLPLKDTWKKYR